MSIESGLAEKFLPSWLSGIFGKSANDDSGHGLAMSGVEGAAVAGVEKWLGAGYVKSAAVGTAEFDLAHGRKGMIGLSEELFIADEVGTGVAKKLGLGKVFGWAAAAAIFFFEKPVMGGSDEKPPEPKPG